ncbi:hypothetical protein CAPTEDRAFT_207396 [Capitella teleta]|uniref:Uncharacterized protein n=1 Tax=Capitella teleta TaxID=283909 RepID=R7UDW1_CAPTE|nr:hypothetical protein CAPTEDRAFT_207396 [Capitella teleta]|eukprot:ELU04595.1 hypothetical protein CAPTEDRAFT_207396 [Capitella teleta]
MEPDVQPRSATESQEEKCCTTPPPETCALSLGMSLEEVFGEFQTLVPVKSSEESSVNSSPSERDVFHNQNATNVAPGPSPKSTPTSSHRASLLSSEPHIFIDLTEIPDHPQPAAHSNCTQPSQQPCAAIISLDVPSHAPAHVPNWRPPRIVCDKANHPPPYKRSCVDVGNHYSDLPSHPRQEARATPAHAVSSTPSASLLLMNCRLQRRLRNVQNHGPLARDLRDFYTVQAERFEDDRLKVLTASPPEDASSIHCLYDSRHVDLIKTIHKRIDALLKTPPREPLAPLVADHDSQTVSKKRTHAAQQERIIRLMSLVYQQDGQTK